MAIENNPGVKLDKPMITRIRDRFKYQRSLLRVSDAIAYFPRVRPTEHQLTEYLVSKKWYVKRLFQDVLKWKPSEKRDTKKQSQALLDKELLLSINTHKWNSCIVRSTGDSKMGKGVYQKG
ncbi:hypothetical protein ACJMK2_013495 [Sinanodonta woodiana]|uniref:Uncharacterized protein n=1 Tax=Sinanodonta woodiana TaxID=1069815 RepID=A0ABD3V0T7_SINWO